MKALFITTRKILPLNDGAFIYTFGILKYMHDLNIKTTFLSFYEKNEYSASERAELMTVCQDYHNVKLMWRNIALNLSLKYPNSIRKYTRNSMKRVINSILKREKFDIVVIDHLHMYEYSKLFNGCKIILIQHNVESDLWNDYAKKHKFLMRLLIKWNAQKMIKYEKNALTRVDSIISISQEDKKRIEQICLRDDVNVMPPYQSYNVIKTEENILYSENKIIFVGSYSWYPNQEAARFLVNELMPKLRKKIEGLNLLLVGKSPTEEILSFGRNNNDVIVTGMVESVDPFLIDSALLINPIFSGSGMNIKMVEAMGKGIPIVSSKHGARGLEVVKGTHLLIFNNSDECAELVHKLLTDRQEALRLRNNARMFYEQLINPNEDVRDVFLNIRSRGMVNEI